MGKKIIFAYLTREQPCAPHSTFCTNRVTLFGHSECFSSYLK